MICLLHFPLARREVRKGAQEDTDPLFFPLETAMKTFRMMHVDNSSVSILPEASSTSTCPSWHW